MKANKGKTQKKVVEPDSEEEKEDVPSKVGRKSYKKSSNPQPNPGSAVKRKNSSESEEQNIESGKKKRGAKQKEPKESKKPKASEAESKPTRRSTKKNAKENTDDEEEENQKSKAKGTKKELVKATATKPINRTMEIESIGSNSDEDEKKRKTSKEPAASKKKRKILEDTTEEENESNENERNTRDKKKSKGMDILDEAPIEKESEPKSKVLQQKKKETKKSPEKMKTETVKKQPEKSGKKSSKKEEEEEAEYNPGSDFEKSESEHTELDDFDEEYEDIKERKLKKNSNKKLKKETPNQKTPSNLGKGRDNKTLTPVSTSNKKSDTKKNNSSNKGKGKNQKLLESDGEKMEEKSEYGGVEFMKAFENADPETLKFSVNEEVPLPEWLMPESIRDAKMRLKSHPDYDPSTVYIPKDQEVAFSPMFLQYWNIKRTIYDTILFLKFGNCYMIFYEDALTIRKELDLKLCFWGAKRPTVTIMDTTLKKHTAKLIERGYKVSIAEQMEKDDQKEGSIIKREIVQILSKGTMTDYDQGYASKFMLALAEEENKVGVCIVDTTTHEFYLDQFEDDEQRNNLRSLLSRVQPVEIIYSQRMFHTSTQAIIKGTVHPAPVFTRIQIDELPNCSCILYEIKRVFSKTRSKTESALLKESVLKEKKNMDEDDEEDEGNASQSNSKRKDSGSRSGAASQSNAEENDDKPDIPDEDLEDFPHLFKDYEERFIEEKRSALKNKTPVNKIKQEEEEGENRMEDLRNYHLDVEKGLSMFYLLQSVNLSLIYLNKTLLIETVFRMGIFRPFNYNLQRNTCLYMNAQTLENLEVFKANTMGVGPRVSTKNTLFDFVDKTKTPFGRRLLHKWMEFPLRDMETLNDRLDAVEDLIKNGNIVDYFRMEAAKLPDLERIISSVYNSRNKHRLKTSGFSHFAMDRLKMFLTLLKDLEKVEEIIDTINENRSKLKSKRLRKLITYKRVEKEPENSSNRKKNFIEEGLFPKISDLISDLKNMVVLKDKLVIPAPGINKRYDKISEKLDVIKQQLNDILESIKRKLKCQDITYQHVRSRYELEIPEKVMDKIDPADHKLILTSKKKGFLRYHTPAIEDLIDKLKDLEDDIHKCLVPFIVDYFMKFYNRNQYWIQIMACLSELDCLCSLASAALEMGDVRCRPQFTNKENCLVLKQLYHPCLMKTGLELVPNDTIFDDSTDVLLVTGPNMGGKSTLLRQVCLSVILAQIGSFVPAKEMRMSLRDKIFSRIGASDSLLEGKSTFFVEMEETHSIITNATSDSIVIIDELGRGTSTYDGVAIAHSVLKYISEKLKCKTLFATHYHLLLDEFRLFSNVKNYYMSFLYNEDKERITFLYKFIPGEASRSFGINVAKIVGLPTDVIEIANEKSQRMTMENKKLVLFGNAIKNFNNVIESIMSFEKKKDINEMLSSLKLI